MMKNQTNNRRIFFAWILILALIPMAIGKTFHTHIEKTEYLCNHSSPDNHTKSSCPICMFTLAPFMEPDGVTLILTVSLTTILFVEPVMGFTAHSTSLLFLRAPPRTIQLG